MRSENIIGGITLFISLFIILYWSFYIIKASFIIENKKIVIWKNIVYSASISIVFSAIATFISDKLDDIDGIDSRKKSKLFI